MLTDTATRFRRDWLIGEGSFGCVYKGVDVCTGADVAIKVVELDDMGDELDEMQREIQILSQLKSPFITRYYGSYLHGTQLWIIMEYCGGGSCHDLIKTGHVAEPHIAVILRGVLEALAYLHSEGKMHRDIKSANVLLTTGGDVKLADFGVAGQLSASSAKTDRIVGTPYWMSPEVVRRTGYDSRADIWSVGILGIELASGEPPYADLHPMKVIHLISRNPPPQLNPTHSRAFRDFVAQCLVRDQTQRPSAAALLKHRFVRGARDPRVLGGLVLLSQRRQVYSSVGREPPAAEAHGTAPWDFAVDDTDLRMHVDSAPHAAGWIPRSNSLATLFT